jgi:hypothetical protein
MTGYNVFHAFGLLWLAEIIHAHGHVTGIIANGKYYLGYTPNFQVRFKPNFLVYH